MVVCTEAGGVEVEVELLGFERGKDLYELSTDEKIESQPSTVLLAQSITRQACSPGRAARGANKRAASRALSLLVTPRKR